MRFDNLILAACFIFISCSQLHVKNHGKIPVSLTPQGEFVEPVEIKGRLEYYLWGNYPPHGRTLYIDEILKKEGIYAAANVSVKRERDFPDLLSSFLSFGMYTPLSYTIKAFKKESQR